MAVAIQSGGEGVLAKHTVLPGLLSIWRVGITETTLGDSAPDQLILIS